MANWQSIDELQDIASDLPRFTHALDELSRRLGLNITPLTADHISLRCHQNVTAERWRRGFEQCGELLSENMINGRPICLFKLHEPVQVAHWQFSIVELPWPGEKRYPHEGWEHIEIVLPGDPETLNARALALLSDEGLSLPGISVKTSSPKGEHERLPNPTLAVTDGKTTIISMLNSLVVAVSTVMFGLDLSQTSQVKGLSSLMKLKVVLFLKNIDQLFRRVLRKPLKAV